MQRAVDVSHWQGQIDWAAFDADPAIDAVGIQLSYGGAGVDPDAARNWAGAGQVAKPRIAYHFAYCAGPNNVDDARAQARHFWQVIQSVGGLRPQDQVALDLEEAAGPTSVEWAAAFLDELRSLAGILPGFYSDLNFVRTVLGGGVGLGGRSWLWLAAYQATEPLCPAGWSEITMWQDSSSGSVAGIAGQVDTDVIEAPLAGAGPTFHLIQGVI